jgi:hypothetical protein
MLAIERGSRQQYCQGHGPPFERRPDGQACAASVMRRVFSHALCSCQDLTTTGTSNTIDTYDSRQGRYMSGEPGAAVGVNGRFAPAAANSSLLGSLSVFGNGTLSFAGLQHQIAGDLRSNSVIDLGAGQLSVGGDVWAHADIIGAGTGTVAGDVYQAPGRTGSQRLMVAGALHSRAFELEPPCPCGEDAPLDIAALVAQAQASNDNAEVGFRPDRYTDVISLEPNELECGRFALSRVSAAGLPDTTINGRTAWFVQGDFIVTGGAGLHFGPQGELDIFITGSLVMQLGFSLNAGVIGPVERPSALRFYVGGDKVTLTPGTGDFAAYVYAPHAALDLLSFGAGYGALFAKTLTLPGINLHYDRAILDADACEASVPLQP